MKKLLNSAAKNCIAWLDVEGGQEAYQLSWVRSIGRSRLMCGIHGAHTQSLNDGAGQREKTWEVNGTMMYRGILVSIRRFVVSERFLLTRGSIQDLSIVLDYARTGKLDWGKSRHDSRASSSSSRVVLICGAQQQQLNSRHEQPSQLTRLLNARLAE